jgi:hypothetical protein
MSVEQGINERIGIWPVRVGIGGMAGCSLWCSGEPDALLARNGQVQLFPSTAALASAVTAKPADYEPVAARLDADTLGRVLQFTAGVFDLDAAVDWLARSDREETIEACRRTLDAINLATDIGTTSADDRPAQIAAGPELSATLDALTYGLTMLGDGSPYRDNPAAMTSAITSEAAAAARRLVAIAAFACRTSRRMTFANAD